MAIRFTIDGVEYAADTAEEAFQFKQLLANGAGKTAAVAGAATTEKTSKENKSFLVSTDKLVKLMTELGPNGVSVFRELVRAGSSGIATDALAAKSGLSAVALPPVIRHVRFAAERCGIDPIFLKRRQVWVGQQPKSSYVLDPGILSQVELAESSDQVHVK